MRSVKNKAIQSEIVSHPNTCLDSTVQWNATSVHGKENNDITGVYEEGLRITCLYNCISNPSFAIDDMVMWFLGYVVHLHSFASLL